MSKSFLLMSVGILCLQSVAMAGSIDSQKVVDLLKTTVGGAVFEQATTSGYVGKFQKSDGSLRIGATCVTYGALQADVMMVSNLAKLAESALAPEALEWAARIKQQGERTDSAMQSLCTVNPELNRLTDAQFQLNKLGLALQRLNESL